MTDRIRKLIRQLGFTGAPDDSLAAANARDTQKSLRSRIEDAQGRRQKALGRIPEIEQQIAQSIRLDIDPVVSGRFSKIA